MKSKYKKHVNFIAEWIKDTNNPEDARTVLLNKTTVYGEQIFTFDEEKDELLTISEGDNKVFKRLITLLGGKTFLKNPDNDIFYPEDDEDDFLQDRVDYDKISKFHKKFKKQYLDAFNILVFYEGLMDDEGDSSTMIYIVDFDSRKIYQIDYEQRDEGDDQWLTFDGKSTKF